MKLKILVLSCLLLQQAHAQFRNFGKVKWTYRTQDKIFTTPALFRQSILTASMDGHLYSLQRSNGRLNWKFKAGAGIATHPLVTDTTVYFGSYDGHYYAVNANSGKLQWQFQTGGERRIGSKGYWSMTPASMYMEDQYDLFLSSPATDAQHVYFGSSDSCIYAVNRENGQPVWKYKTNGPIHGGVTYSNNIVLVGSWDTYVYALDAASGKLIWKFKTNADPKDHVLEGIQSTPVVVGNTVYIGTRDARLYAMDIMTGQRQWQYLEPGKAWVVGSAVVEGNHVYVGTSDSYLMMDLNASNGELRKQVKGGGYIFGAPAVYGNTLCYGDFTGRLFLVNTPNWQQTAVFETPGRIENGAQVLDSAGNINFMKIAAGAATDKYSTALAVMEKLFKLGPFVATPVIAESTVYATSTDGTLYAIELK
ncbi:MAG: PQQ-binding-like beta-propeller repeat protein [Chitinophaga sp.]|uniref:outer membrane protein assembly factor BamB family protein n=1 Tax=Chitinophaga sp. TaxID=1869181 RepID=UPI0025B901B2|nr:PQQ-binding-like beta-propeller repeat protein [Chitinophaga sp.]MBV8253063.1 PQQ-binding-like beta-propeller repeat protein [Chitinophaga sp.]